MPNLPGVNPEEIEAWATTRKAAAQKMIDGLLANAGMPQGLLGGEPPVPPRMPPTDEPAAAVVEQKKKGVPIAGPALMQGQPPIEDVSIDPSARPQHIEQALKFLKVRENFSSKPYIDSYTKDGKPRYAIGFGSQVDPRTGEAITAKTPRIGRDEAFAMKETYVTDLDAQLDTLLKVPVNPSKRAALLSFMYNIGPEDFAKSTLLKKINSGSPPDEIWAQLKRFVYSRDEKGKHRFMRGLLNRRKAEFKSGLNTQEESE